MMNTHITTRHFCLISSAICHVQEYFAKSDTQVQEDSDTHVCVQVELALTKRKLIERKKKDDTSIAKGDRSLSYLSLLF